MSRKVRIQIEIVLVIIAIIVAAILILKYAGNMGMPVEGFSSKDETVFDMAEVSTEEGPGNSRYVKFKDVVVSAANVEGGERYYRFDLTVQVADKEAAEQMMNTRAAAIAMIRNTVSQFRAEDVRDRRGVRFMKSRIENELAGRYGYGVVEDVYFENLVHD